MRLELNCFFNLQTGSYFSLFFFFNTLNCLQSTSVMLAQRHSSVFHAGVIGDGPRKTVPNKSPQLDTVMHRTQLLIEVIKACCSAGGTGILVL